VQPLLIYGNHYREIEKITALASSEEGMKGIDECVSYVM
jgi:hypothetical protein